MKKYGIAEIFGPTVQGEGSMTGTPCVFIRFAGCNMWSGSPGTRAGSRCPFCDTDFRARGQMTAEEIVKAVTDIAWPDEGTPIRWVVISGGEPMLQLDSNLAYRLFAEARVQIAIETNGSLPIRDDLLELIDHVTLSPKEPAEKIRLHVCHDLKVLYPSPHEGMDPESFSDIVAHRYKYVQPIDECGFAGADSKGTSVQQCLEYVYKNPQWRLSVQMHKVIGVA